MDENKDAITKALIDLSKQISNIKTYDLEIGNVFSQEFDSIENLYLSNSISDSTTIALLSQLESEITTYRRTGPSNNGSSPLLTTDPENDTHNSGDSKQLKLQQAYALRFCF